jgi:O-6-methylguanine DNA methyltransferase
MYYGSVENGVFEKIRRIVKKIPHGQVATYGQVAMLAGIRDARQVGWAMWGNQDPTIPCHRVIKKDGSVAKDYSLGGWKEQKYRLELEGVEFINEMQVNLKKHLWVTSARFVSFSRGNDRQNCDTASTAARFLRFP